MVAVLANRMPLIAVADVVVHRQCRRADFRPAPMRTDPHRRARKNHIGTRLRPAAAKLRMLFRTTKLTQRDQRRAHQQTLDRREVDNQIGSSGGGSHGHDWALSHQPSPCARGWPATPVGATLVATTPTRSPTSRD